MGPSFALEAVDLTLDQCNRLGVADVDVEALLEEQKATRGPP